MVKKIFFVAVFFACMASVALAADGDKLFFGGDRLYFGGDRINFGLVTDARSIFLIPGLMPSGPFPFGLLF